MKQKNCKEYPWKSYLQKQNQHIYGGGGLEVETNTGDVWAGAASGNLLIVSSSDAIIAEFSPLIDATPIWDMALCLPYLYVIRAAQYLGTTYIETYSVCSNYSGIKSKKKLSLQYNF